MALLLSQNIVGNPEVSLSGTYDYRNCTITFSCEINSATPEFVFLRIDDGVGTSDSATHSGSGNMETLTVSRMIDDEATQILVYIWCFDIIGYAFFDNASVSIDYYDRQIKGGCACCGSYVY